MAQVKLVISGVVAFSGDLVHVLRATARWGRRPGGGGEVTGRAGATGIAVRWPDVAAAWRAALWITGRARELEPWSPGLPRLEVLPESGTATRIVPLHPLLSQRGELLLSGNLAVAHGRRGRRELHQLCIGFAALELAGQRMLLDRILTAFGDGED